MNSCLPGPTLRRPQAQLVTIPQERSLGDREGGLAATNQGWDSAPGGRHEVCVCVCGGARVRDTSAQVSLCTAVPTGQCLLSSGGSAGRNCRFLGSAADTASMSHPLPPCPASASLRASTPSSSFLPAFSFFLSPHITDCGSKMAQIYGSTHQK